MACGIIAYGCHKDILRICSSKSQPRRLPRNFLMAKEDLFFSYQLPENGVIGQYAVLARLRFDLISRRTNGCDCTHLPSERLKFQYLQMLCSKHPGIMP